VDGNLASLYDGQGGTGTECGYVQYPVAPKSLSRGTIVGFSMLSIPILLLIGFAYYWMRLKRRHRQATRQHVLAGAQAAREREINEFIAREVKKPLGAARTALEELYARYFPPMSSSSTSTSTSHNNNNNNGPIKSSRSFSSTDGGGGAAADMDRSSLPMSSTSTSIKKGPVKSSRSFSSTDGGGASADMNRNSNHNNNKSKVVVVDEQNHNRNNTNNGDNGDNTAVIPNREVLKSQLDTIAVSIDSIKALVDGLGSKKKNRGHHYGYREASGVAGPGDQTMQKFDRALAIFSSKRTIDCSLDEMIVGGGDEEYHCSSRR
jgi:hypothetical protein